MWELLGMQKCIVYHSRELPVTGLIHWQALYSQIYCKDLSTIKYTAWACTDINLLLLDLNFVGCLAYTHTRNYQTVQLQ